MSTPSARPTSLGRACGENDWTALVTAAESELERELSSTFMRSGGKIERRRLVPGEALVKQGEERRELFLLLDGVLDQLAAGRG